jgi:hypothetical protein
MPAIDAEIHINDSKKPGGSKQQLRQQPPSSIKYPSIIRSSHILQPGKGSVQTFGDGHQAMPHACCVGILSSFEERFHSKEKKDAIIEGGWHGLCGLQVTASVDIHVVDEGHETVSQVSTPEVKGPYDKRARFISPMPSIIMPNGRRGTSSTQPHFSRRRCAVEYKQPRKPLDLAEHPSRRAAPHPNSTATHKQSRQPLALAARPVRRSFPVCTASITQPLPTEHAFLTPSSIITKETVPAQPVEGLKLPPSKPNSNCTPPRVRFAQDLVQQIPYPVTVQYTQINNHGKENQSTSILKPKKRGPVHKLFKSFSSLLGRYGSA